MKGLKPKSLSDFIEKRTLAHLMTYALLLGPFICFFSSGFFHPDEHFSIIELMNLKLGNVDFSLFNWDVTLKMRSFLQPAFYFVFYKCFEGLGGQDPFIFTFIIKLIGYILGVFSLYRLAQVPELISDKRGQKITFLLAAFTWYTPFIFARTSSENLSSSLFFLSLPLLFSLPKRGRAFGVGLLWAFSFGVRYQVGIAIAGAFFWGLYKRKVNWRNFFQMGLSFTFGLAIILLVDFWGYGEWTFTPWNYLRENLIHSRAAEFGVSPWYYYFTKGVQKGIPPLGLIYLLSLVYFVWKFPKSLLTWIVVPFVAVHSAIGHKEVRFLFFVYLLLPFMFYKLWDSIFRYKVEREGALPTFLYSTTFVINLFALLWVTFTPAHGPLAVYKWLYRNGEYKKFPLYTLYQENKTHLTLSLPFYLRAGTRLIPTTLKDLTKSKSGEKSEWLLITSKFKERQKVADLNQCGMEFSIYPEWALKYNWFKWRDRSSVWTIWKCNPQIKKAISHHLP